MEVSMSVIGISKVSLLIISIPIAGLSVVKAFLPNISLVISVFSLAKIVIQNQFLLFCSKNYKAKTTNTDMSIADILIADILAANILEIAK